MPICRCRRRASPSSSSEARSCPATRTLPALRRSSPASTIISVDLPEPEGPSTATASPIPMVIEMPRRMSTGPAALGNVKRTSSSLASRLPSGSGDVRGGYSGTKRPRLDDMAGPSAFSTRAAAQLTLEALLPSLQTGFIGYPMSRYREFSRKSSPAARIDAALIRRGGVIAALLVALFAGGTPVMAKTPEILAFGDSLTAGFGLSPDESFHARLQAKLRAEGIEARVVNAGVSGDTTAGGLARLDWALADKPDLVILELGANDALRGIDPATVRANLEAIIAKVQASGAKLLLTGMRAPPNWGEEYQQKFDRIYPELAHARD